MRLSCFSVVYKGGNFSPAQLGRGHCECRPAGVWRGGTFVFGHGTEQLAWCERALRAKTYSSNECFMFSYDVLRNVSHLQLTAHADVNCGHKQISKEPKCVDPYIISHMHSLKVEFTLSCVMH